MHLLDFPNEIILYMTSFLIYPNISNLMQASKELYNLLNSLYQQLPWKVTTFRKQRSVAIQIKVGWFNLSSEVQKWSGISKKSRKGFHVIVEKGIGGPLLIKMISTKEPYVEFNAEGEIQDIHVSPQENTFPAHLQIGYLHPHYCSSPNLLDLTMGDMLSPD